MLSRYACFLIILNDDSIYTKKIRQPYKYGWRIAVWLDTGQSEKDDRVIT